MVVTTHGQFTTATFSGQDRQSHHLQLADYYHQRNDVRRSIEEYRLAVAMPVKTLRDQTYIDFVGRMPLSAELYRTNDVLGARAEWVTILQHRRALTHAESWRPLLQPAAPLAARRLDTLAQRAVPNWNPSFFDSGAGQHMELGLHLATQRRYDAAAAEWRTSAHCDTRFEPPHLMLGYYDVLQGDLAAARLEWVAALEGSDPAPGDMLGITSWQYDAMAALLRYTPK